MGHAAAKGIPASQIAAGEDVCAHTRSQRLPTAAGYETYDVVSRYTLPPFAGS